MTAPHPRMTLRRAAAVPALLALLGAPAVVPAAAGDAHAYVARADLLRCAALIAGTAGVPEVGPRPPETDEGNPLEAGDPSAAPRSLPRQVRLRGTHASFNRRFQFAVARGMIWYRSNTAVTGIKEPWAALPVPDCFDGSVVGLAVDDDELVAIDAERWIYTMDGALGAPALFSWTKRWGPPVWTGPGRQLPARALDWDWSVVSIREDGSYVDTAGNEQEIGFGKVSHVWVLSDGGRRMTYLDPWLPDDESYEMCAPHRGRFRAVDLSASGSLVAVLGRHGDVFTRFYDFDIAGNNGVFYRYSYDDQHGLADPARQLPSPAWVEQPKVPGTITDRISVHKVGPGLVHRVLRVEGRRTGRSGYWHKDLADARWRFTATDQPLAGRVLDNPASDTSGRGLAPSEDRRYSGTANGATAVVPDFNTYCSPSHVRFRLATGERFTLRLLTVDRIRQARRARGLDDEPRRVTGVLAVPSALRAGDPEVAAFVAGLGEGRFVPADLSATLGGLTFVDQGWMLTHG